MDESLVQHKFVVMFQSIKHNLAKPIDCIFKYKYDLFSENEVITTPTFKVDPGNEFQEITKGCSNTFVIHPNIKAASVKHSLENQILNIKIFDQDQHIGNSKVNLNRVYNEESQKLTNQSFWEELPISNEDTSDIERIVGTIELGFILFTEDHIRCKPCKRIFKLSGILKHIIQTKECQDRYSDEEINVLKQNAIKRRKQKNVDREFQNYDPKKRAEKHKRTYDSEKEKKSYNPKQRRMKYIKEKANEEEQAAIEKEISRKHTLISFKNDREKWARKLNHEKFCQTKWEFKEDCQLVEGVLTLPFEGKEKINKINQDIEDLFKTLCKEIDAIVEEAKDVSKIEEAATIFTKLVAYNKVDKDEAEEDFKNDKEPQKHRIWYQWFDLKLKNSAELKEIAKKIGWSKKLDGYLGLSKEEVKKKKLGG